MRDVAQRRADERHAAAYWGLRVIAHLQVAETFAQRREPRAAFYDELARMAAIYAATCANAAMDELDYCDRCGGLRGMAAYDAERVSDCCACAPRMLPGDEA